MQIDNYLKFFPGSLFQYKFHNFLTKPSKRNKNGWTFSQCFLRLMSKTETVTISVMAMSLYMTKTIKFYIARRNKMRCIHGKSSSKYVQMIRTAYIESSGIQTNTICNEKRWYYVPGYCELFLHSFKIKRKKGVQYRA